MTRDDVYLRRAIRLAMNGRGWVEPNPMVGCVIVKNDRVLGEGFHQQYGHPHAEPQALESCTESPVGATAYVTLEPCCHTNKKTPPCAPRLIAAKIARVVIGCLDPNPDVNGNGVKMLRDAGIVVEISPLEAECKQLIAPFLARTNDGFPYVTLKWAQSADGKVAGPGGKRVQISNTTSSHQVQLLRSRSDGIAVGVNTILADDPMLLPREVPLLRPYRRMVLDTHLRTPLDCNLVKSAHLGPVEVYTTSASRFDLSQHVQMLVERGVSVISEIDVGIDGRLSLHKWFDKLRFRLAHLLIEPGPTLAKAMLPICDRLWVIYSPKIIGDNSAPSAATIPDYFVQTGEANLDGDRLCEYLNQRRSVYFAPVQSADFVLAKSEVDRVGLNQGDTPRL